jgi:hypothetical protein
MALLDPFGAPLRWLLRRRATVEESERLEELGLRPEDLRDAQGWTRVPPDRRDWTCGSGLLPMLGWEVDLWQEFWGDGSGMPEGLDPRQPRGRCVRGSLSSVGGGLVWVGTSGNPLEFGRKRVTHWAPLRGRPL